MQLIKCYETGQIFKSISEASVKMNIHRQLISQAVDRECAANGFHFFVYWNDEQARELEIKLGEKLTMKQAHRAAEKTQNDLAAYDRELLIVDLFKSWYNHEKSIRQCSEESGYSEKYLYRLFRNEKISRGLV